MTDPMAKIKGRIVEKGMTYEYVAKKSDMDRSTLFRKTKNGGAKLTVSDLRKIVKALEMTAEEASAFVLSLMSHDCDNEG